MSVIISTTGNILNLTFSDGRVIGIEIANIQRIDLVGDDVFIYQTILENNKRIYPQNPDVIKLDFNTVTSPVYGTAALLHAGLLSLIAATSSTTLMEELIDRVEELNGGYSILIGKPSGGDFVTSYNDGTSIDCDSLPASHPVLIAEDIEIIQQIDTTGAVVETYMRDEVTLAVTNPAGSTYRITITAPVVTFVGTDTFIVKTNVAISTYTTVTLGTDTYTEGITKGNVIGVVRNDAGTTLVDTDGEIAPLQVNANGMLNTNLDNIRDAVPDIGSGNAGGGTLRVSISDDDTNLAAINARDGALGDAADVDGTTAAQLRYIGEAVDGLEDSVQVPFAIYKSPDDFSATYTSSTTITLAATPFTVTSEQIAYIKYIPVGGTLAAVLVNGQNGVTITISSNVISVDGASTPFASGDVYEIGINGQAKAYDSSTDQFKGDVNTVADLYTDVQTLVTAQDLTAAYADFGAEIQRGDMKKLGVWVIADCNDSQDVLLKALGKHTSGGTDEYEINGTAIITLWSGTGTDFKKYYEFDFGVIPIIQLQAIAGTLGATAGDLTISITKIY
jgi:hypothetical protein